MTKSYIEEILKSDEMISEIAIKRTHFSCNITYFSLIEIFFEVLNMVGIICSIHSDFKPFSDVQDINKIEHNEIVKFTDPTWSNHLYYKLNVDKVNSKLNEYNQLKKEMGFKESAIFLIDIFLDILEE